MVSTDQADLIFSTFLCFMNIDGTTLILLFLTNSFSAVPQKPPTLTSLKIRYENLWSFLTKNLDSSANFLTTKNTTLKLHEPKNF